MPGYHRLPCQVVVRGVQTQILHLHATYFSAPYHFRELVRRGRFPIQRKEFGITLHNFLLDEYVSGSVFHS